MNPSPDRRGTLPLSATAARLRSVASLASALDEDIDRVRDLARDTGPGLDDACRRLFAAARRIDRELARTLSAARATGVYLVIDVDIDDLVRHLARAGRLTAGSPARTGERDRTLVGVLAAARVTTARLVHACHTVVDHAGPAGNPVEAPAPHAVRMTAVAVRFLPPAHRPRYRAEFAAELHELAAAGRSRSGQLAHACGLLRTSWSLRRALAASAPVREASRRPPAPSPPRPGPPGWAG